MEQCQSTRFLLAVQAKNTCRADNKVENVQHRLSLKSWMRKEQHWSQLISSMVEVVPAGTRGECQKDSKAGSRCRSISTWVPLKSPMKGNGTLSNSIKFARAYTGGLRELSYPPFLLEKIKQDITKGDEAAKEDRAGKEGISNARRHWGKTF